MANAEKNLLAGIEFFEPKEPTQRKGKLGYHIPSVEELTGASMEQRSPKTGKLVKTDDLLAKPSNVRIEED